MPQRSGETVRKREATPEVLPYTAWISPVVSKTVDGAAQAREEGDGLDRTTQASRSDQITPDDQIPPGSACGDAAICSPRQSSQMKAMNATKG